MTSISKIIQIPSVQFYNISSMCCMWAHHQSQFSFQTPLSKPRQIFAWVPTVMAVLSNGTYNNSCNELWGKHNPSRTKEGKKQCSSELRGCGSWSSDYCFSQFWFSCTPWSDLEVCGPSPGGFLRKMIALGCVSKRGTGMLGRRRVSWRSPVD